MPDSRFELMRHALGVQRHLYHPSKGGVRYSKPYRNHFVAGLDHEIVWDGLVAEGFATRREGGVLSNHAPTFFVTDAGREAALAGIRFKRRWGYGSPTNP